MGAAQRMEWCDVELTLMSIQPHVPIVNVARYLRGVDLVRYMLAWCTDCFESPRLAFSVARDGLNEVK